MQNEGGLSFTDMRNFIRGIDFPCSKQDLIENAEDNDAPDSVIDMLDRLPDREYESFADLMKAVGQAVT